MNKKIEIKKKASVKNDLIAEEIRSLFKENNLKVINMISSPGSGKTSILEVLGKKLGKRLAVITGDVQTTLDAQRISKSGAIGIQIQTGGACHLTAEMIKNTLHQLKLDKVEYLVIENIGNLVCPSNYDLGEDIKIAVLSVTEGDEKPIKYPSLFIRANAVIINKIDLAPYVDFSFERAEKDCKKLNSDVNIFKLSCKTGMGIDSLLNFIKRIP